MNMQNTKRFKDFVSLHFSETRAFVPLRNFYQTLFNREWAITRAARLSFYRQFVKPGSLTFDVGANVGDFTDTFLHLVAQVVAFEPNTSCCSKIRALGHKKRLMVRCEAIGDKQGEVDLFVGKFSGHSTVSKDWMQKASTENFGYRWSSVVKTRMNTLDQLKKEYGTPEFLKIDVEGFELSILRGMSFRPSTLSFEFHSFTPEAINDCLSLPVFDSVCNFNLALGDSLEFVWSEWRDTNTVLEYVSQITGEVFGDVYARFV